MKHTIDKDLHIHTFDESNLTAHCIQRVNYSTSYCSIDNIDIYQFAYRDGTEGITQSQPIQTSITTTNTKSSYSSDYHGCLF